MPIRPPRSINMIQLGRALTDPDLRPPVKALYVYNANPATIVPNQELVLQGLRREDLFTVVHEQHLTDTTDYADLVLPATTSMEHTDCYKSYGHLYLQLARPVIPPEGQARSNWTVTRDLARAMGLRDPHFAKSEDDLIREVLGSGDASVAGITLERLGDERSVRLRRWAGRTCRSRTARPPRPARSSSCPRRWPATGCPPCPPTCRWWKGRSTRPCSAVSAPVHRAAQPLLPELVVQPVRAEPAAPARARGAAAPGRRGGPRHRRRGRGAGAQRARARRGSPRR